MKQDNEIYEGLRRAINDLTPDVFDKISSAPIPCNEETNIVKMEVSTVKLKIKILNSLVAACLVVCISLGGMQYSNHFITDSVISIDVNPSIQLTTNHSDQVLKVVPLNEDANIVLDGMDLCKVNLDVAINAITGSMIKHGYLTKDSAEVLISVQNKDSHKANDLSNLLSSDFSKALNEYQITGTVLSQTLSPTSDADLTAFAKNHNISYGKALFIHKLVQKDASLSAEKLASLPLRDITGLLQEKKMDIKDIIKYDNVAIDENIEDVIEDINEKPYSYDATHIDDQKQNYIDGINQNNIYHNPDEFEDIDGIDRDDVEDINHEDINGDDDDQNNINEDDDDQEEYNNDNDD